MTDFSQRQLIGQENCVDGSNLKIKGILKKSKTFAMHDGSFFNNSTESTPKRKKKVSF